MTGPISGKAAPVTGGSRGIGAAVAGPVASLACRPLPADRQRLQRRKIADDNAGGGGVAEQPDRLQVF